MVSSGTTALTTTSNAAVAAISAANIAASGKPTNVIVVNATNEYSGFVSIDDGTTWLPFIKAYGGTTIYNHIAVTGAVSIKRVPGESNISCFVAVW